MKKIFYSLLFAGITLGMATSCEEDRDSNPVLNTNVSTFTLNTPANASNVYDLENSEYVNFTTSQPDYGITAAVTYVPYISIDNENFQALTSSFTTTDIAIPAGEINTAILNLVGEGDLSEPIPVYFKLAANLSGLSELGVIESNVVTLPNVLAYVPVVEISIPDEIYIVGDFPASQWGTFVPLHPAYSVDGMFYGIVYIENGKNFRFALSAGWGETFGWTDITPDGDVASALSDAGNDNNMTFNSETGLYTVILKVKIANGALVYTLSMTPAKLYVFGAAAPNQDNQWAFDDGNLFTIDGGVATSPALGASGELRLSVDCGTDWWKTEFTIMTTDGTLYYRNEDIAKNWASDKGEEYSYQGAAGKQVVLDFTTEPATGSLK